MGLFPSPFGTVVFNTVLAYFGHNWKRVAKIARVTVSPSVSELLAPWVRRKGCVSLRPATVLACAFDTLQIFYGVTLVPVAYSGFVKDFRAYQRIFLMNLDILHLPCLIGIPYEVVWTFQAVAPFLFMGPAGRRGHRPQFFFFFYSCSAQSASEQPQFLWRPALGKAEGVQLIFRSVIHRFIRANVLVEADYLRRGGRAYVDQAEMSQPSPHFLMPVHVKIVSAQASRSASSAWLRTSGPATAP